MELDSEDIANSMANEYAVKDSVILDVEDSTSGVRRETSTKAMTGDAMFDDSSFPNGEPCLRHGEVGCGEALCRQLRELNVDPNTRKALKCIHHGKENCDRWSCQTGDALEDEVFFDKTDDMWLQIPKSYAIVKIIWKKRLNADPIIYYNMKIGETMKKLSKWSRGMLTSLRKRALLLETNLASLQSLDANMYIDSARNGKTHDGCFSNWINTHDQPSCSSVWSASNPSEHSYADTALPAHYNSPALNQLCPPTAQPMLPSASVPFPPFLDPVSTHSRRSAQSGFERERGFEQRFEGTHDNINAEMSRTAKELNIVLARLHA